MEEKLIISNRYYSSISALRMHAHSRIFNFLHFSLTQYLGKNVFTDEVVEGDVITLGKNTKITVYDVPCHTAGHVLYHVTNLEGEQSSLITGDTLFVGGVGHFFEGTV